MRRESVTLYCLPHAGGNSFFYRSLVPLCPAHVTVCPLELPGRGRRSWEALCRTIPDLVEDLFPQLAANREPYALLGHSMGALLAWGLAQKAVTDGARRPEVLFLAGAVAPLQRSVLARHRLPKVAFFEMLRELGGCPPEVLAESELLDYFEPILRADFEAVDTWQLDRSSPLPVPLVVLNGRRDTIAEHELQAWKSFTSVSLSRHDFEGGHFFIRENWKRIAEIVGKSLAGEQRCSMA